MHVAMVGPFPSDGRTATGGVEAVAMNLVEALARLPGVRISVVTLVDGPQKLAVLRRDNISIWHVSSSRAMGRASFFVRERRQIATALRALRPDIVHIQGQNVYAVATLGAGPPAVVTLHGLHFKEATITDRASGLVEPLYRRARGYVNARYERYTLNRASNLIIINPYVRRSIAQLTHARLHDIPNPIPHTFFDLASAEVPGRILYCGTIEPRKGTLVLVEAMARVCRVLPQAHLHLVGPAGDSGYTQSVRRAIASRGLAEAVRFRGVVPPEVLLQEYAEAAVVVLPSREESSPMVLQQAMAAGKAIVATLAGGIPDLIRDGATGSLVPYGDAAALAERLVQTLQDQQFRSRLGRAARQDASDRFRAEVVAARTAAVYTQILSSAGEGLACTN